MNKPHKQVVTTSPVAIRQGQARLHVADEHPWHRITRIVKCPKCEVAYIATGDFPKEQLLTALEKQHQNREEHPDYFPSAPEFTRIDDCECGM